MARLPQPGSDNGKWGDILNEYLSQTLKTDGTIKDNAITSNAIAPGAVTASEIASDAVTATQIQDGTITEAQLNSDVRTKLNAVAGTPDWSTITGKPAVIAAGADQAAARTVIGAGTASVKADVGLANVDNTSDVAKNSAAATLTNKTINGAQNTLQNIAQSSVTNLTNDLSSKVNQSAFTTKGDILVAAASGLPQRIGVGSDGLVLSADSSQATGVRWIPVASGGAARSYATNVGNGTAGPFTITHNLGSRDVLVNVYRNGGTFEEILVRADRVSQNTVVLRPDETWAQDQYRIVVGFATQSDVTIPTAPTLASAAHDISSVSLAASGATDDTGVAGYNWYRDGSFIAQTAGATYTHSNLNSATSYTFTVTAFDVAGNESSPSNSVVQATDAPANVAYASSGAGGRNTANSATSWSHTVGSGVSRYMVVAIVTSSLGGAWDDVNGYPTKTVTSSLDGALTYLGGANNGFNGQSQGGILLFGKANPTVGSHTIDVNIVSQYAGTNYSVMGNSVVYTGVGSIGTTVVYQPYATGPLALTVNSAATNMVVGAGVFGTAPSGFNQTTRYSAGASINGDGDYMIMGDAAGATTVNFTTTSNAHYRAGVGINLIKVGN